jgi:hypothetical protein
MKTKEKIRFAVSIPLLFVSTAVLFLLLLYALSENRDTRNGALFFLVLLSPIEYGLWRLMKKPLLIWLSERGGLRPMIYGIASRPRLIAYFVLGPLILAGTIVYKNWPTEKEITPVTRKRFPSTADWDTLFGKPIFNRSLKNGKPNKFTVVNMTGLTTESFSENYEIDGIEYSITSSFSNYASHKTMVGMVSSLNGNRNVTMMDKKKMDMDTFAYMTTKSESFYYGTHGNNLYKIEITPGIGDSSLDFGKLVAKHLKVIE